MFTTTERSTRFLPHLTRSGVRIEGPTCGALFLERLSRFSALVSLNGEPTLVHVPNSGRMRELLVPGRPCLLAVCPGPLRKTSHDLLMVDIGERWVGVDARMPSLLLADALSRGVLPPFQSYSTFRAEVRYGKSRLDFLLSGESTRCLMEAKNVNRLVGGRAVFPDAPTLRGTQHLHELMAFRDETQESAAVFIVQRDDADSLGPDDEHDPVFSRTLRQAAAAGVGLHAWRYHVSPQAIVLDRSVPVILA